MLRQLYICILYAVSTHAVRAQEPVTDDNLTLTADTVTCEHDKNICTALGHVHVIHTPKDKKNTTPYTLDADKLIVYFQSQSKTSTTSVTPKDDATSIRKIDADGQVIMIREGVTAHADRATFEQDSDTVTLTGHVRIIDKDRGHSESDSASFNRKTGVYTLHNNTKPGGSSRVRIFFNTSSAKL